MKRVIFLLCIFLSCFAQAYSQPKDVLKEGDSLTIVGICSQCHQGEIYVYSNGVRVKKVVGENLLASQKIAWDGENEWIKCRNERTQSYVIFMAGKKENAVSLYEQYRAVYRKARVTRGSDEDRKKYMEELLSGTWYMCFDEVWIESRLPQSRDERRLYFAGIDSDNLVALDYQPVTNEIVISKSKLEKMGIVVSDNKHNITLKVYYSDGEDTMQLITSELEIIYKSY